MDAIFISVFILLIGPYQPHVIQYDMTMQECLEAVEVVGSTIKNNRVTSIQGNTAIYIGSGCLPVFVKGEL